MISLTVRSLKGLEDFGGSLELVIPSAQGSTLIVVLEVGFGFESWFSAPFCCFVATTIRAIKSATLITMKMMARTFHSIGAELGAGLAFFSSIGSLDSIANNDLRKVEMKSI